MPKAANNSIYGELKLSTQLLERIKNLESAYNVLKTRLEQVTFEKDNNIAQMKNLQKAFNLSMINEEMLK